MFPPQANDLEDYLLLARDEGKLTLEQYRELLSAPLSREELHERMDKLIGED